MLTTTLQYPLRTSFYLLLLHVLTLVLYPKHCSLLRCRLYGLLAWFHAIVQERLRYPPHGWTKKYEFTEADAQCALDVIDHWVDEGIGPIGRAHIDPAELPWKALHALLSQSLYGGRVDQAYDQVRESMITFVSEGRGRRSK